MINNSHYKRQLPFVILVVLLLVIFLLDRSVQYGLFLDGLIYASIARNMAEGMGSFWVPYYAGPDMFFSHPPLMFGLQAVFFKIFGSFYGTEKIYNFVIWLITVFLIRGCWRTIDVSDRFKATWWVPLLFWGFMPSVLWAYPNNILDSTMAMFDLAAIVVLLKGKQNNGLLHVVIAALLLFCASFTKGLSGLFPLIVPAVYSIVYNDGKLARAIFNSLLMAGIVAAIYLVLWQFPQPQHYLNIYYHWQIVGSLRGMSDNTASEFGRFDIVLMILTEVAIMVGVCVLVYVLSRLLKTGKALLTDRKKHVLFFLLIGLSASLPLMVSYKVRSFYLVPALPYFAIAGGVLMYPFLIQPTERYTLGTRYMKGLNVLFGVAGIVALALMYGKAGTIGRDHEIIEDVNTISQHVPATESVIAAPGIDKNYEFMAYMQRHKKIDLYYPLELNSAQYIIADGQNRSNCYLWRADLNGYRQMPTNTKRFVVYKK
ncbi:MAG: hypothetical protein EOP56_13505 [Sphingobacteriales bacterium]|nr:MAG: hypothetical protein EOP56_13505 [Sphingobacteriales bacterium]